MACIAKKVNVYKENDLDRGAARGLFNSKIGSNPNFAPIIGNAFDQCYSQLSVNVAYEQSNPPKCSALPMLLLDCMQTSLFLVCIRMLFKGSRIVIMISLYTSRTVPPEFGKEVQNAMNLKESFPRVVPLLQLHHYNYLELTYKRHNYLHKVLFDLR